MQTQLMLSEDISKAFILKTNTLSQTRWSTQGCLYSPLLSSPPHKVLLPCSNPGKALPEISHCCATAYSASIKNGHFVRNKCEELISILCIPTTALGCYHTWRLLRTSTKCAEGKGMGEQHTSHGPFPFPILLEVTRPSSRSFFGPLKLHIRPLPLVVLTCYSRELRRKQKDSKNVNTDFCLGHLHTHLPASHLVLSFCPHALLSTHGFMITICTGHNWCQTKWGEKQVLLTNQAAWLYSGSNYKTAQRAWLYCFLLIHHQIRFICKRPFPAPSTPHCHLADAVAQVSIIWPAEKL